MRISMVFVGFGGRKKKSIEKIEGQSPKPVLNNEALYCSSLVSTTSLCPSEKQQLDVIHVECT